MADALRKCMPNSAGHVAVPPRAPPNQRRVNLEFDQALHGSKAIAKKKARALQRAEQVAEHRERAALYAFKQHCWPTRSVDAAVNCRRFQAWINLNSDARELAGALQVSDACTQACVTHGIL